MKILDIRNTVEWKTRHQIVYTAWLKLRKDFCLLKRLTFKNNFIYSDSDHFPPPSCNDLPLSPIISCLHLCTRDSLLPHFLPSLLHVAPRGGVLQKWKSDHKFPLFRILQRFLTSLQIKGKSQLYHCPPGCRTSHPIFSVPASLLPLRPCWPPYYSSLTHFSFRTFALATASASNMLPPGMWMRVPLPLPQQPLEALLLLLKWHCLLWGTTLYLFFIALNTSYGILVYCDLLLRGCKFLHNKEIVYDSLWIPSI